MIHPSEAGAAEWVAPQVLLGGSGSAAFLAGSTGTRSRLGRPITCYDVADQEQVQSSAMANH